MEMEMEMKKPVNFYVWASFWAVPLAMLILMHTGDPDVAILLGIVGILLVAVSYTGHALLLLGCGLMWHAIFWGLVAG